MLLRKLLRSDLPVIGLDAGFRSIKAVKIQKSGNTYSLLQHVSIPVPADDPIQRAQAVQQALVTLGDGKSRIFSGVGGPGTVLRSIVIPRMSREELKMALQFEAEK